MRELSAGGMARMRNQIHFRETRSRHVPAIGLHRNVVLEQIARVGTELAQDHLLGLSSCFPIALINGPQILPSPLVSQPRSLLFSVLVGLHLKWRDVVPFGYILDGSIRLLDFMVEKCEHLNLQLNETHT